MNDEIHLLLAVALVAAVLRPDDATPYLIAIVAVAVPMADRFTVDPMFGWGYLSGPVWAHRGVSHSLLVGAVVVAAAAYVGYWRAGAIGYLAHLVPDAVFGGVRPLLPFDATVVRWFPEYTPPHYTAMEGTVALASGLVVLAEIYRRTRGGERPLADWYRRWRRRGQEGGASACDSPEYEHP